MRYKVQDEKGNIFETKDTPEEFKIGDEIYADSKENVYHGELRGGSAYGNMTKILPVMMKIEDSGNLEIIEDTDLFKSFKFDGKLLKGYYILRREDLKSDIWIFSKGRLPGEKLTPESFFEADSTGMSEFSNSIDLSTGAFPIQIQYKDTTYTLIETKNDKLLLNKK